MLLWMTFVSFYCKHLFPPLDTPEEDMNLTYYQYEEYTSPDLFFFFSQAFLQVHRIVFRQRYTCFPDLSICGCTIRDLVPQALSFQMRECIAVLRNLLKINIFYLLLLEIKIEVSKFVSSTVTYSYKMKPYFLKSKNTVVRKQSKFIFIFFRLLPSFIVISK